MSAPPTTASVRRRSGASSSVAGFLLALAFVTLAPFTRAATDYELIVDSATIENDSPKAKGLTAGHPAKIRINSHWAQWFLEQIDLTLAIDGTEFFRETHSFRNNMGEYSTKLVKSVSLPANLSSGRHTLTVQFVEKPRKPPPTPTTRKPDVFRSAPFSLPFDATGTTAAPPPAAPQPPPTLSSDELLALYTQRTRDAGTRVAQEYCRVMGVAFNPSELKDNSGSMGVDGIQFSYQIKGGKRLLDEVFITVNHSTNTPELVRQRGVDGEIFNPAAELERRWSELRSTPEQPQFLYWDFKYAGIHMPADAPPRPPGYEVNLGPVHVSGTGQWTASTAFGPYHSAAGTVASSPFHAIHVSSTPSLPAEELERIRAKYYPVPPGIPYAERKIIDEKFDAEVKQARQDGGRQIVLLLGDIGRAFCPLLEGSSSDQAALQRLAAWTPPDSNPPTPPAPDLSSISIPGVHTSQSTPPSATATPPATPEAMLRQLGEQSAARAAAAIADAVPSAEGLAPAEIAILAEAALSNTDPTVVMQEQAADEQALTTTGNGDALTVVNASANPERPDPGTVVTVTLTVRNTATSGAPAIFDVGLSDYHDNNRDVATLRRRSLAPGATGRYTLQFPAPRAYNFGGYAYVDPLLFSGDELPQQVVNLRINWDGATMTDADISAELRDRNPCPDDYALTPERLGRWVELYRTDQNAALAGIEREAIAAQRDRLQADYEARLNDPGFQQQVQLELEARANTQLLTAYDELLGVAQRLGMSNRLDLVAIIDDEVFVDANNRLHGDLALARRRMMAAVKEKQATEITAVDRMLLAGIGNKEGTTATYQAAEPVMSPTLAINGLVDQAIVTPAGQAIVNRIMREYRQLTEAYREANTDVRDVQRYAANLRDLVSEARTKLNGAEGKFFAEVLEDASRKLDKLDAIAQRATAFQQRARTLLGGKKVVSGMTTTIATVGELWAVYEVGERVRARANGGEDLTQAILAEGSGWGAKKLVLACPVIGAADTALSGMGHLANYMAPDYFKARGIDPTQLNASTLVDIGTGATLAGVTDGSAILARRLERLPPLTTDERAVLEARLTAFEERLNSTTDPALRERLLIGRSNVRQTLRDRR